MLARLLSGQLRVVAGQALHQFLPVYRRMFKIEQTDTRNRRLLVLDGFFGIVAPSVGGRYPQTFGERDRLKGGLVNESAA